MKNRQKNLLKHAKKAGHNAIVALDPENLFYMTGFWGEAIGVLDSSGAKIIAPALEASRAKADSSDCKVFSSDRGSSMITDLVSLLHRVSIERIPPLRRLKHFFSKSQPTIRDIFHM